ncbi:MULTISPECIES: DUF2630 family protein [Streptomyces]|uniref:DUF2630 family protein n=1 Tax=Streptomyces clavifer TaxID=68188 RepID=A0ABS4V9B6_9ACTN|nr:MULTISPECIES: DUF2630 family protein [Streptomyces]KQX77769.1 hypothetical protein ASD26_16260 [Streptomyces sp. Root1319]KQZ10328.1 hypothetical protein ASD51_08735 [Streptomyces sp. Root55]MBP2360413.1 hypothetical protein [Streptomyces clavifer]MDX2743569.1 DUF2630 family protein [Streptomyces sp. NRRL_B-2557]MDX3066352.1 DUF2630 family protein [Streptomyces sp. ND04-05B]
MGEQDIFEDIGGLVSEERALRARSAAEPGLSAEERSRLREVEIRLDQCWDLLRQRRALSEFGDDPSLAEVRPADEVEGYQG